MPKQKKPKQGEQHPRIKITPSYDYTDGIDAGDLACAYGLTPDKWQQDLLNICLGRDKDDHFTSSTFALSVPRQNGKNGFLEMIELYHLTTGSHNILHTAHEVKTARKSFMRLAQFFTHNEDLAEICKSIRYANGQEAIYCEWKDEKGRIKTSSIEWSARSRGAARGFSCSMIVLDEAQELTNEQMQALMPTLSAANEGQRQVIMTGTPPPPGSVGDVFRNTRRSALSDGTNKDGLSWLE